MPNLLHFAKIKMVHIAGFRVRPGTAMQSTGRTLRGRASSLMLVEFFPQE